MTTFLEDEESVEDSQPREGYEFKSGVVTYRLTGGDADLSFAGVTYLAEPVMRSEVVLSSISNKKDLEITLPVSHPLVQRFFRGGIPPKKVTCVVRRLQTRSGVVEKIWSGSIVSVTASGHTAKLLVPSTLSENLQRRLPVITVGRQCPHVLYDPACGVVKSDFTLTGTVVTVSDRTVVVQTGIYDEDFAKFGEMLHVASGETMTIFENTSYSPITNQTTFKLQLPIVELQIGDTVRISAGCAHDVITCFTKFANQMNFGGQAHLPTGNPFIPNGFGIYQVE